MAQLIITINIQPVVGNYFYFFFTHQSASRLGYAYGPQNIAIGANINQSAQNLYDFMVANQINNDLQFSVLDNVVTVTTNILSGFQNFGVHELVTYDMFGAPVDGPTSTFASITYDAGNPANLWTLTSDYVNNNGFTLDNKNIFVQSASVGYYYEIAVNVSQTFASKPTMSFEIKHKILLFKGLAKFNVGQMVHRLMQENRNDFGYFPSKVNIIGVQKSMSNNTIFSQIILPEVTLYAGYERNFNNFLFLDINNNPTRVIVNSYADIHFIAPSTYRLKIFKNGTLFLTFTGSNPSEYTKTHRFEFFTHQQGDVFEFKLCDYNDVVKQTKKYIVFPQGRLQNMISWLNEYLVECIFAFTGGIKLSSEFEYSLQRFFRNNSENIVTSDVRKDNKITISTGWITKNDVNTIESILRSKKVSMTDENGTIIRLIPQQKPIINHDSDRELIEYTIEFLINRNYDAETYSF